MKIVHDEKNLQEINEIYCVLSKDDNGDGICNAIINGISFQLVSGYKKNIETIKEVARTMKRETNKKLFLCKFIQKEIIEEIL